MVCPSAYLTCLLPKKTEENAYAGNCHVRTKAMGWDTMQSTTTSSMDAFMEKNQWGHLGWLLLSLETAFSGHLIRIVRSQPLSTVRTRGKKKSNVLNILYLTLQKLNKKKKFQVTVQTNLSNPRENVLPNSDNHLDHECVIALYMQHI